MSDNKTKAAAFWAWFASAEDGIRKLVSQVRSSVPRQAEGREDVSRALEEAVNELSAALERFDGRLAAYISAHHGPDGDAELVISAEGDVQAFPAAKRLVAHAPAIAGWRLMALKPREPDAPEGIQVGGEFLPAEAISYALAYENGLVDILIVLDCEDVDIDEETGFHTVTMLEEMLGEEDLATRVGGLGLETTAGVDSSIGLRPIAELPGEFDEFFRH